MAISYDPAIFQKCADELYRQAKWIVITMAFRYGFSTLVIAELLKEILPYPVIRDLGPNAEGIALVLALIGVALGVGAGRRKAFALKLQAQQVLCQREIELNTRQQGKALAATQT